MKKSKRIVLLGETLVDFFFESIVEKPGGHKQFAFNGAPGGAPANVAANLASMKKPVSLISAFSTDPLGIELRDQLIERGIDLDFSTIYSNSKMPMAMVLRSQAGERSFQLYLNGTVLEELDVSDVSLGEEVGFFHFGSVLLVFNSGVKATETLLKQVQATNTVRSYDINVRPDILRAYPLGRQALLEFLNQVDVLKISSEDLVWIQANVDSSLSKPEDYLRFGIKLIAYTQGSKGASLITPKRVCHVPAPKVKVVDTTGSGDAFMAGVLASLYGHNINNRNELVNLGSDLLLKIGTEASECAKLILGQEGAMPPITK